MTVIQATKFESMISCIDSKTKENLEAELEKIRPDFKNKWACLQEIMDTGGYTKSTLFKTASCRYLILEGLKQDLITDTQASTLLHFWEIVQTHPEAQYVPFKTIEDVKILNHAYFQEEHLPIDSKCLNAYIFALPSSERGIFWICHKKSQLMSAIMTSSRIGSSFFSPLLDYFYRPRNIDAEDDYFWSREAADSRVSRQIVPSIGIYQAFLNTAFPSEMRIQLVPKLGMSSEASIRENGLKQERDLFTPLGNLVKNPDLVDRNSYNKELFDIARHDFYHAIRAAFIPFNFKEILIETSDQIEKRFGDDEKSKKVVDSLRDMECPIFEFCHTKEAADKSYSFKKAATDVMEETLKNYYPTSPNSGLFLNETPKKILAIFCENLQKSIPG